MVNRDLRGKVFPIPFPTLPGTHTSTQAKGLLVSIPVLTPLHLQLLCRSIGTGWKKKKKIKRKEKDTKKKKESKNKLSAMNGAMDLAGVVGGGAADGAGRGGPEAPAHCTNTQEGSRDLQNSPDLLKILANS